MLLLVFCEKGERHSPYTMNSFMSRLMGVVCIWFVLHIMRTSFIVCVWCVCVCGKESVSHSDETMSYIHFCIPGYTRRERVMIFHINVRLSVLYAHFKFNKGNAKRGVSPRLKIRPCDLELWPWKSIGFQILLRSKYVPSLVKIHWRMLILVFTRMLRSKNLTQWHWPLTYDLENQ